MKTQKQRAMALLVGGLMLLTVAQIVGRQFGWSDTLLGVVTGAAVGFEILALLGLRSAQRRPQ